MTENDYIAKYVKEKHPQILGIDYTIWKIAEKARSAINEIVNVLRGITWDEKTMEAIARLNTSTNEWTEEPDNEEAEEDETTEKYCNAPRTGQQI